MTISSMIAKLIGTQSDLPVIANSENITQARGFIEGKALMSNSVTYWYDKAAEGGYTTPDQIRLLFKHAHTKESNFAKVFYDGVNDALAFAYGGSAAYMAMYAPEAKNIARDTVITPDTGTHWDNIGRNNLTKNSGMAEIGKVRSNLCSLIVTEAKVRNGDTPSNGAGKTKTDTPFIDATKKNIDAMSKRLEKFDGSKATGKDKNIDVMMLLEGLKTIERSLLGDLPKTVIPAKPKAKAVTKKD